MAKDKTHPLLEPDPFGPPDPYDGAQRNATIARSSGDSPELVGRLRDISAQSGLSVDALREASQLSLEDLAHGVEKRRILRQRQAVASYLAEHPQHALVSHDDAEALYRISLAADRIRAERDEVGANPSLGAQAVIGVQQGLGGLSSSIYGLLQMGAETLARTRRGRLRVGGEALERFAAFAADRAAVGRDLPSLLLARGAGIPLERADEILGGAYARTRSQIFGIGIDDVAATAFSLAPTLAAAPFGLTGISLVAGAQSTGGTFAEKRAEGASVDQASGLSLLSGAITASLTRLMPGGTERVAQLVRKAGDPAAVLRSHLIAAMGKEGFGEFMEEGLDEALQALLVDGAPLGEAIERGLKGGTLGAIFGAGFGVAPGIYAGRRQTALAALDFNQRVELLDQELTASKTLGRSQELTATFLQGHAGLNQNAYVDGAALAELSQEAPGVVAQLERVGVDQQTIQRALESGGTVELPLARFLTALEPEVKAALKPLLRSHPNAPSAAEAQAFDTAAEATQAQAEETEDVAQFRAEYVSEVTRLASEVSQAQAVPMEVAQAQVLPLARAAWSFYERNPGAYDSPMDLLRRVTIQRGTAEEGQAAVAQATDESVPESSPPEGAGEDRPGTDTGEPAATVERVVGVAELGEVTGEIGADFERRQEFYQSGRADPALDGEPPAVVFEPMPGLAGWQSAAEAEFARQLAAADLEALYAGLPDTENGKVLNVDAMRAAFEPYAANREGAILYTLSTHEPASSAIKQLYDSRLAHDPQGAVLFFAGGAGSGKSTIQQGLAADAVADAEIVVDGVFGNPAKAVDQIEKALASGRPVDIHYVYLPLAVAASRAEKRFQDSGRFVPPGVLTAGHVGAIETVLALAERYGENPAVRITAYDNTTSAKEISVAELAALRYTEPGESVEVAVSRLLPTVEEALANAAEEVRLTLHARAGSSAGDGSARADTRSAGAEAGDQPRADAALPRAAPEEGAEDGVEFRQEGDEAGGEAPRGSVLIHDTTYLIRLFQRADLSTILHETGHVFLEEMRSLVRTGRASEQTAKDWQTLAAADMAPADVNQPITRAQHERLAQGFETYLATAEAPSIELEPAFARFRRWLSRIYAAAKGVLVDLPSEVRSVFDRMLAADDEIRQVAIANEWTNRSGAELDRIPGVAEGGRTRFNALMQAARQRMADALWKERTRRAAERRSIWREAIDQELAELPVYRAWEEARQAGGLRQVDVLLAFGEDTVKALREKGLIAAKTATGVRSDDLALRHGFEDGEAAVLALLDAPPPQRYRQERLAQIEAESDAESSAMEAVLEAPEFLEAMEALGTYLTTAIRGTDSQASRQQLRRQAERVFAETPLAEATRIDRYLAALQQATRAERKAVTKDDFAVALEQNRAARLNFELARLAREARRHRDATIKRVRAAARAKLGTIDAQHHQNLVHAAVRHGLIERAPMDLSERQPLALVVAGVGADFDMTANFLAETLDESRQTDYRNLSVEQFQDLANLLSLLEKRGRMLRNETIARGQARIEDVVSDSQGFMAALSDKTPWFDRDTRMGKAVDRIKTGLIGALTQMDYVMRAADGFNGGRVKDLDPNRPLTQHIVLRSSEAERANQLLKADLMKALEPHRRVIAAAMDRLGTHPAGIRVPYPEQLRKRLGKKGWTNRQLLGVALSLGNSYNAEALAIGYGFKTVDQSTGEEIADLALLIELASQFTAAELQAVQGTWDAINTLWAATAETHERLFGFRSPKVKPDPITIPTADGQVVELPGGYFPLRFDNRINKRQGAQDEAVDMRELMGAAFPSTASAKRGHTMARTNSGGKPVLLDPIRVLTEHIEFATRFISHGEFVFDANRIFTDPAWAETFTDKFGDHIYRELNGWLRAQLKRESEGLSWFDDLVEYFRPKTALYLLGFRPSSAITQLDALASLPADIGVGNYLRGLRLLADPQELVTQWQTMMERSPFMRERLYGGRDREMNDMLRGFDLGTVAGAWDKTLRVGQHVALAPIIYPSLAIEAFGWISMFHASLPKVDGDVDRAATLADEAIASSQPATRPKDLARMQRSRKGVHRVLTLLMTFAIRRTNANAFAWKAIANGQMGVTDGLTYSFLTWVIAPTIALALKHLIWGTDLEDEDEQKRLLGDAAQEILLYQVQGIPLVRDVGFMTREVIATGRSRQRGPRTAMDTAFRLHKEMLEGIAALPEALGSDDPDELEGALWALADLTSFYLGIPVVRAYRDIQEGLRQVDEEDAGVLNVLIPDPELRR